MSHILIIHGAYGSPEENWFPWLKRELEKEGHKVSVPAFPTPENQSLINWFLIAANALMNCDPKNTILIGHSIGAALAWRLAEVATEPFKAIIAVCPFTRSIGLPEFDGLNATFYNPVPGWDKVRKGARKIICFAGSNDPYVPEALWREVAENAHAELTIVKNGGHLNAEAGYREFPLLLDKLRELT